MPEDQEAAAAPDAQEQAPAPEMTPDDAEKASLQEAILVMSEASEKSEKEQAEPEPEPAPGESADDLLAAVAAERQSIMSRMEQMRARETELDARTQEVTALMNSLKEDPVAFMNQHAGENWYMDATKRFLNKGAPSPEEQARREREELEALRKEVRDLKEWREAEPYERQTRVYLDEIQAGLQDPQYRIVAEDPTAVSELHKLVEAYAREHQQFLPASTALGKVKQAQIERLQKLRAIAEEQALLEGQTPHAAPTQQAKSPPSAGTISNTLPARGSPPILDEEDIFDEESRIKRAIAAMSGD